MIIDGWFDWAEKMPGPSIKLWDDINTNEGVLFHSAVGSLQGVIDVVFGPITNERSVTGVIGYDGRFIQFYPVTASPWANGNHETNRRFIGFENEGGEDKPGKVNEPLTEQQIDVCVRILKDLSAYNQRPLDWWHRPIHDSDKQASLWEHKEMVRFGASSTACPSGRIPWDEIIKRLNEDMLKQEGNFLVLYNGGIPVWRWGSTDGLFPGRVSKLFGDKYLWLRASFQTGTNLAYWSEEEGD